MNHCEPQIHLAFHLSTAFVKLSQALFEHCHISTTVVPVYLSVSLLIFQEFPFSLSHL